MNDSPSPYSIAILTVILSGFFTIVGFYLTAKWQFQIAITEKRYEYRMNAYNSFLSAISRNNSPIIAEILNIGELSKHVATDAEIQVLEDKFSELSKLNNEYKISWQLDSDFSVLRLYGSDLVRQYCDDILSVLVLREYDVEWNNYPKELVSLKNIWVKYQENGIAYGWEEKVTGEERVMFVILSAMYKNLLTQLRNELYGKSLNNAN